MAIKKKTTKPVKSTLDAVADASGSPDANEHRRPPVTQVVEVVEEESETPARQEESLQEEIKDESAPSPALQESENSIGVEEAAEDASVDDEKRRMLVDELFQKGEKEEVPVAAEVTMHRKSPSKSIFMWAIVLIVASLIVGGVLMVMSGKTPAVPSFFAKPTPTPTPAPTPTPTPDVSVLDKKTLTIQVLNGSGISGEAGKMKTLLEEKGYTVEDTGNAPAYDYETTEIQVKEDKQEFLSLLTQDLKESYSLSSTAATLEEDVPYDVRIIVGKE